MQAAISQRTWLEWALLSGFPEGSCSGQSDAVNRTLSTMDDAQLLQRIAQGDRQAFSQLYDRYSGVLYSTTIRILKDPEEASDVLQDVFLQIWEKAGSYDPKLGKPFNWALTLTRNKAIDRLRSLKRRYSFIEEVTQELADSGHPRSPWNEEFMSSERAALIRAAVETLPLEQRQAIEMAFLGGLTQNEIAQALQQPLGTVKARIRRGMLKLRASLTELL
jgi:RNA polymerase sigma-70 factor, ECF subfamily